MNTLADLRRNYSLGSLDEADVDRDPFRQFDAWFAQAIEARIPDPNAMTLSTVDLAGQPSARIVLVKCVDERGFVFFTNYESRKGIELEGNRRASLLFYWSELERQVHVEGAVLKTSEEESDAYFLRRPDKSKVAAWASEQSRPVDSRATLEAREQHIREIYGDCPPRPPHWGGFRLVPERIEFWQGGQSRMHDRLLYVRSDANSGWQISRLAP